MPEISLTRLPSIADELESSCRSAIAQQGNAELAQRLSITVRVYPNLTTSNEEEVPALDPLLHPDLLLNRMTRSHFQTIKRGMDIVFSALLLTLLLPLFALIAVLVKLSSPGPVFSISYGWAIYWNPSRCTSSEPCMQPQIIRLITTM